MIMLLIDGGDGDDVGDGDYGDNKDFKLTSTCEKSVCMGAPMMMSSIPSPFISLTATE